jgi:hypothetical protein
MPALHEINVKGSTSTISYNPATKNFWQTDILLEILLVEHRLHDVIEVIVWNPARRDEISRFYMTTSIFFTKFTAEDIEKHLSLKKVEFSDVNGDLQYSAEPPESKTKERVIQDLAVQYVKRRLAIESDQPLKASLNVLPGDTTNADGQLDQICGMPLNLKKIESLDCMQSERV